MGCTDEHPTTFVPLSSTSSSPCRSQGRAPAATGLLLHALVDSTNPRPTRRPTSSDRLSTLDPGVELSELESRLAVPAASCHCEVELVLIRGANQSVVDPLPPRALS